MNDVQPPKCVAIRRCRESGQKQRIRKMPSSLRSFMRGFALACVCALSAALVGCKAKEAQSAGFVDKAQMSKDPSLPFQRAWKKPGFDKSKYSKLYIAPVNTAYMLKMTEWEEGMRKEQFEQDVAKLATYTQEEVKKAFRADPQQRMQILDAPNADSDALIVEIALIEVVPSKVALNALVFAPFGIGTSVMAVRSV